MVYTVAIKQHSSLLFPRQLGGQGKTFEGRIKDKHKTKEICKQGSYYTSGKINQTAPKLQYIFPS